MGSKSQMQSGGIQRKVQGTTHGGGYTQMEGVGNLLTGGEVCLILAIVTHLDLELYKMDVKIAFINGEHDGEIYMDQPIGFTAKGQECKVCKLRRSIYGLKQSSR